MIEQTLPVVALSIGDVNGIGPELLLRLLLDDDLATRATLEVVGSAPLLLETARHLDMKEVAQGGDGSIIVGKRSVRVIDVGVTPAITWGTVDAVAGELAARAIVTATKRVLSGDAAALVTMPISKSALKEAGVEFPGHTEMIASITGGHPTMMLLSPSLRIALATIHIPLSQVAAALREEDLPSRLRELDQALRVDFAIDRPRIAVLGLNPHAGEEGNIGSEEIETIAPAIATVRAKGIDASGPYPADAFFARRREGEFDAVLAMYHDQGLIPLKMSAEGMGVNVTLGLPIVRTSPDHGTAFDIAGRGIADPSSARAALLLALDIAQARRSHDAGRAGR